MGDQVIEELFTLAFDTGIGNINVILAPVDLRAKAVPRDAENKSPDWIGELYAEIRRELLKLKK